MYDVKTKYPKNPFGCSDFYSCKNYCIDKCSVCERCTGNADCYDLYEDLFEDLLDPLAEEADPDAE